MRHTPVHLKLGGLLALLGLLLIANLLGGAHWLAPRWLMHLFSPPDGSHELLVLQARLPRVICGLLAGIALAIAGIIMQTLCRNPLADPGLLGVNAGASASLVTLSLLPLAAEWGVFWQALPGALLASAGVYLLSRLQQSDGQAPNPTRLLLAGAAISAVLGAYVQARVMLNPQLFDGFRYWMAGSLAGLGWVEVSALWPYLIPAALVLWLMSPSLDLLLLDRNTALSLGAHLQRHSAIAWLCATLLCAAATAVVGPLAFVGLAAGHLARAWFPCSLRLLLLGAGLIGALLVLMADLFSRTLLPPRELLTGIMIAALGAPFLYLIARRGNTERGRAS